MPATPDNADAEKTLVRNQLRRRLESISPESRRYQSQAIGELVASTPEFAAARIVMAFLSTAAEVDTSPLILKCWQAGKTVVVPKVSWNERRMLPVEITSLRTGLTTTERGLVEPIAGKPIPVSFIDLVVVPGLGFTPHGHRIGRGMGFYDRFLGQDDFFGVSCGLAFDQQIVPTVPVLDHDIPLSMLVTDHGIRRFASNCIPQ